jgi:TM2 domain-containing membrane protein YozV
MSDPSVPPPPPPPVSGPSGAVTPSTGEVQSKKIAAGICGILIGSLGIHKFILGYQKEGLIMLLVTVLTCGIGGIVMGVIGLIEGIIYLTKSDEEFIQTYQIGHKGWF